MGFSYPRVSYKVGGSVFEQFKREGMTLWCFYLGGSCGQSISTEYTQQVWNAYPIVPSFSERGRPLS